METLPVASEAMTLATRVQSVSATEEASSSVSMSSGKEPSTEPAASSPSLSSPFSGASFSLPLSVAPASSAPEPGRLGAASSELDGAEDSASSAPATGAKARAGARATAAMPTREKRARVLRMEKDPFNMRGKL